MKHNPLNNNNSNSVLNYYTIIHTSRYNSCKRKRLLSPFLPLTFSCNLTSALVAMLLLLNKALLCTLFILSPGIYIFIYKYTYTTTPLYTISLVNNGSSSSDCEWCFQDRLQKCFIYTKVYFYLGRYEGTFEKIKSNQKYDCRLDRKIMHWTWWQCLCILVYMKHIEFLYFILALYPPSPFKL